MTNAPTDRVAEAAANEAKPIATQPIKEGGRGAVLLAAARLDLALEKLLKATMLPNSGGDDNLFDSDRPLGTFSAKIALAYRLGLIDKAVEHSLQMIRRVRNDFAHSFEDASLSDHSRRNRLSKPYQEARKGPMWSRLEQVLAETNASHELRDFICLVVTLVSFAEAASHMQQPHEPAVQVRLHAHGAKSNAMA